MEEITGRQADEEQKTVARMLVMGSESLNPDLFEQLEQIVKELQSTRRTLGKIFGSEKGIELRWDLARIDFVYIIQKVVAFAYQAYEVINNPRTKGPVETNKNVFIKTLDGDLLGMKNAELITSFSIKYDMSVWQGNPLESCEVRVTPRGFKDSYLLGIDFTKNIREGVTVLSGSRWLPLNVTHVDFILKDDASY